MDPFTEDDFDSEDKINSFSEVEVAKYDTISNNGTELNVTGLVKANNTESATYMNVNNGYDYGISVPDKGSITEMNFTLTNPEKINQSSIVVNDTLSNQPSYNIAYEDEEYIGLNSTFTVEAESVDLYPLGNISIHVNSSEEIEPNFYLNYTDGDGIYSFNVSRENIGDLNVSIKFYYENDTLYSTEIVIVSFYDFSNTTINSIEYSIQYTHQMYLNQTGTILIDSTDGSIATVGDIDIQWDNVQKWSFTGDGIHQIEYYNDSIGIHQVNVLIYTVSANLYANESFDVEIIPRSNTSIENYSFGDLYYNITYNSDSKTGHNASISLKTIDTTYYSHGDINITIENADEYYYENQSGVGEYIFNVKRNTAGSVNLEFKLYNSTSDLNITESFSIIFFENFNEQTVNGIEYEIKYPANCYIGFNGTVYLDINDGTNLTVGNIGLYYDNILNNTFNGAGNYENNITADTANIKTVKFEFNYTLNEWFYNQSFLINFASKPTNYGTPIIQESIQESGLNTTTTDPNNINRCRAISMEFTLIEPTNITGFTLFCESTVIYGDLIFDLHENNYAGSILQSEVYPTVSFTNADWHTFNFETETLSAGTYCLVINGTQLSDLLDVDYDYFDWYCAPGNKSSHDAFFKVWGQPWTHLDQDYLLKIEYQEWVTSSFNEVKINGTVDGLEKEYDIIDSNVAKINFTEEGPWTPDIGQNSIMVSFNSNITCKVDFQLNASYDVLQKTNKSYYEIIDTDGIEPIEWDFIFPGSELSNINIQNMDVYDYQAEIQIPENWYALNGSSIGYSENYGIEAVISLNTSAAQLNWNFESLSSVVDSDIEIKELTISGINEVGRGEDVTVYGTVPDNYRDYYANVSIWHNDDLNYTDSIINNTLEFRFSTWSVPSDAPPGEYEAYIYWCNGTDIAIMATNFTVKLKASFTGMHQYGDIYYEHNNTFNFTFTNYFTQQPINDGIITTNWTTNLWSFERPSDGLYSIEFNTTGLEKGSRRDVNITISSTLYKNETVIFPIFILVNTSVVIDPNYDEFFPEVNQTLEFHTVFYSEFDMYGVRNESSNAIFSAKIGSIQMPIYITEEFEPYYYSYTLRINLTDFPLVPQIGNYNLLLNFQYRNTSIHYETQNISIQLHITPQIAYLNINSTSAFIDTDVLHIYDYIGTESLEIVANLTKKTPCGCNDFEIIPLNNATITAQLTGPGVITPIDYLMESIGSGFYRNYFDISQLTPNKIYEINLTLFATDIENVSKIIEFQLIQKLDTFINFNNIPNNIKQFNRIPISGDVYVINGSVNQPIINQKIRISITYTGISDTYTDIYYVLTSSTGSFSLNNITAPDADDYLSMIITITLEEGRYFNSSQVSQGTKINKFLFLTSILIAIASIGIGMFLMFIFYRYYLPKRRGIPRELIEPDILRQGRKISKEREQLKSKLENYIK
ncbi:MAG: hypothetical protein GF364_01545, partial [Candidatus Lokiarchaeota archaeon]|nr:hypothetical protein [Candidatus Lokiarchaeota archaeon]